MAYIMFVDNDFNLPKIEFAAHYLQNKGHRVCILTDGLEAEKSVTAEPPDILVTALMVRRSDAYALAQRLREGHPAKRTAIILLTPMGEDGEPVRHWPLHFDSYVMGSRDPWQIILAAEQFLHRHVTPNGIGQPGQESG